MYAWVPGANEAGTTIRMSPSYELVDSLTLLDMPIIEGTDGHPALDPEVLDRKS